jgi:L-histidine N-alpha-methyltransferase
MSMASLALAVREGLTARPKRLPCRLLYDAEGSRLFEEICGLPEYYLTRADREILAERADEIAERMGAGATLVELGSGSGRKTSLLIAAFLRRAPALRYAAVDISAEALQASARELAARHPGLSVHAVAAEYEEGFGALDGQAPSPRLILFLGSNIGNCDRAEAADFLGRLRARMAPSDRLLLGVDLRKDKRLLEAAYDDARGVTARFNLNLLGRINRELGGRFDLSAFAHRAEYRQDEGRVLMWLVSRRAQAVPIDGLGLKVRFEEGEAIHTEDSYKYSPAELDALARAAGLRSVARWTDRQGRFVEELLAPQTLQ